MKKIHKKGLVVTLALALGIGMGVGPATAAETSTLLLSGGNGVFGIGPISVSGTASAAGVVKFFANGEAIIGCEAVATTTATPFVAKCAWVPKAAGAVALTGSFTPTDAVAFTTAESPALNVKVGTPVQGVVSPIHIYVDTVLASGTSGPLAPRFGVSCAITSEYIVGQGIVFRVYANNADQGGAVMDSTNTQKAYIEIAGVKDPITLTYGNHSGAAFWTAVLRTGTAAGQYNTLGLISYKVTMIAKDSPTMKVLSTKLVAQRINGIRQVDSAGKTIYERVTYYREVKVNPVLKGATGTWQSNFMAASQLTLFAAPKA
jgi:hypothetical protein